jgi:hypothetical protein
MPTDLPDYVREMNISGQVTSEVTIGNVTLTPLYDEKTGTGTTADAYANTLSWDVRGFKKKSIYLLNTGGTNSLIVQVDKKCHSSGLAWTEMTEQTIAAGSSFLWRSCESYATVILKVKSASAGLTTTYQYDAIGVKL